MNLLLTGAFDYSAQQIEELKRLGYKVFFMQHEHEVLPIQAKMIDAVVCNGLFLHHDIDSFTRLQFIQLTSAGLDRIPIEIVSKRNILLYNAKGVYSIPMAEWVLFRVLEYYKQAVHFRSAQAAHSWTKIRNIREINGKRVAILGVGDVGQQVAKRFQAFGAYTIGFDIAEFDVPYMNELHMIEDIDVWLPQCDIVVVTMPLTSQTKHFLSKDKLSQIKKGSILVNISRGGVIDEAELTNALYDERIAYAILDVFENEPLDRNSPLWDFPNVAISPHNSFVSDGVKMRMFNLLYKNLEHFISLQ
ncbi:hypothetical protein K8P02_02690 [Bacteroides nordii]|uniref:NAD(P)-dependent oxidoreductase n=1 Tax=Bacteroides nordii TaxID=291645 RepID=UPI00046FD170|nr:NAD(P)-dependent oxidoreductase [Bacteroides nordii]UAK43220.1 hypothetical protein K8P02_02690 [Bacteroides nordii]